MCDIVSESEQPKRTENNRWKKRCRWRCTHTQTQQTTTAHVLFWFKDFQKHPEWVTKQNKIIKLRCSWKYRVSLMTTCENNNCFAQSHSQFYCRNFIILFLFLLWRCWFRYGQTSIDAKQFQFGTSGELALGTFEFDRFTGRWCCR